MPAHRDEGPGLFDGARAPSSTPPPAAEPVPADPNPEPPNGGPPVYTVSALTRAVAERLDDLGRVRVEGEITDFRIYGGAGHHYFKLKEGNAVLDCKLWGSVADRILAFEPEDGMQVLAYGRLDVYAPRGSYSLVIDRLEPLGLGARLAQLEKLKAELAAAGWFARARPLPAMPRTIGLVTSRDGAALRDFLKTRSLRWPGYPLRLCHSAVQGAAAAREIAAAIARLDASGVDAIVVCRGGGSLEDLWAFNERPVAEAIWRASVPVVTGVGHETDTTLADLVADLRAHTPTDAAQTVIPDRSALEAELARRANYLTAAMESVVGDRTERLARLARRPVLRDATWILGDRARALRGLFARMAAGSRGRLHASEARMRGALARLERRSPRSLVERWSRRLGRAGFHLAALGARVVAEAETRLGLAAKTLEATSPLAVLGRGYSVTTRAGDARPLTDAGDLAPGDALESRLFRGRVRSTVDTVEEDGGDSTEAAPDPKDGA